MMLAVTLTVFSQQVYESLGNGNYEGNNGSWTGGGKSGDPLVTGDCLNCIIKIRAGHKITVNQNINLSNANILLEGAGSELLFTGAFTITLTGNSSIDLRTPNSRIFSNASSPANTIKLSDVIIFTSNVTMVNSTIPGTVLGAASASSSRSNKNFSNFTLPVTLNYFKVKSEEKKVTLEWSTDLEINSDYFDIERSSDSKNWSRLGSVKAAGNVSVSQAYTFSDLSPLSGENYYRLKIVDLDSRYEYSPIKSITINSLNATLSTYPNPASKVLNIEVPQTASKGYLIRLINRSGQVVHSQKYSGSTNIISLSVGNFAEGAYIVEVTNDAGKRQSRNVLIMKK